MISALCSVHNTQDMLDTFPHLTTKEFQRACSDLRQRYRRRGLEQSDWEAVEVVQHPDGAYLNITRALLLPKSSSCSTECEVDGDEDETVVDDDEDDEVRHVVSESNSESRAIVHYDVILSPVYRVPVLYIHISDPLHRYPPTMTTLHEYLIPPQFRVQTDSGGVLGGVSVNVSTVALCVLLRGL